MAIKKLYFLALLGIAALDDAMQEEDYQNVPVEIMKKTKIIDFRNELSHDVFITITDRFNNKIAEAFPSQEGSKKKKCISGIPPFTILIGSISGVKMYEAPLNILQTDFASKKPYIVRLKSGPKGITISEQLEE